jgi:transposase
MPVHQKAWGEVLDHLNLVAGIFDELGIADILDQVLSYTPETGIATVGSTIRAMVLNGLGFVNQRVYLMLMFVQNKSTQRFVASRVDAHHLHDDTLGRTMERLYDYEVTPLYSFIAATAAKCLGLAPTFVHLGSTSFHVAGRYDNAEELDAAVIHLTRGYIRDHRPDFNQVMLDLMVEHLVGIPLAHVNSLAII